MSAWIRRRRPSAATAPGAHVAALGARLTAYEASMRTVQTQSAERHQVEPRWAGRFRR
ncbi:hypothetical protein AB0O72_28095 [Streptomyces sp. NPDC088106]|uniref:hypothetical protein n=1 Tax=unclassified Streptomyces TaxID=2593676 RepID=UPI003428BD7A